jgi:hypothetical protein
MNTMTGYRTYERTPPAQIDRVRCSACGMWNNPRTTPKGGEFHHINASYVIDGTTYVVDGNGSQGCRFCGCTAWLDGGSLGDMSPGFAGR